MKFKIRESFHWGNSETENNTFLIQYARDNNLISDQPAEGPVYILPNGKFVNLLWFDIDVHGVFFDLFQEENKLTYDDFMGEAEVNLGWIRANSGTAAEDNRSYIDVTIKPTNEQYEAIETYFDFLRELDNGGVMVFCGRQQKTYSFEEYLSEDIVKKIKRYFSSGTLYEDFDETDTVIDDSNVDEYIKKHILPKSDKELLDLSFVKPTTTFSNGAMFILPNGDLIDVREWADYAGISKEMMTHTDFGVILCDAVFSRLENTYTTYDACGDLLSDLTFERGWIRLNAGMSEADDRCYAVLSNNNGKKPTNAQYEALMGWLDYLQTNGKKSVMVVIEGTLKDKTYAFSDYTSDDIIKRIKRYYTTGTLYESIKSLDGFPTKIISGQADVVSYILNNIDKGAIRAFYDWNNDCYLLAPAYDRIHIDLILDAIVSGYYSSEDYADFDTDYNANDDDDLAQIILENGYPMYISYSDIPEESFMNVYKLNLLGKDVYIHTYEDGGYIPLIKKNLVQVINESHNDTKNVVSDDKEAISSDEYNSKILNESVSEDLWVNDYTYKPTQDSKYKRLIQKPINTLTLNEIKYIFVIHKCWYLSQTEQFDTVEDALTYFIDDYKEVALGECYDFVHSLNFPLTIYRAIRNGEYKDGKFNIGGDKSSLSWSVNLDIYSNDKSKFRKTGDIVSCKINSNIIDIPNTINNFVYYTASNSNNYGSFGEYEITLKPNFKQSDLQDLHWVDKGGNAYYQKIVEDIEMSSEYDSEGNQLTKAQAEFFKNSEVRDKQGRLLVCYHGSLSNFTTFDKSKFGSGSGSEYGSGFYFSYNAEIAGDYGETKSYYLNLTNPFIINGYIKPLVDIIENSGIKYNKDVIQKYIDDCDDEGFMWDYDEGDLIRDTIGNKNLTPLLQKLGYDGLINETNGEYIAYESNQIKSIDNKNPTSSNNINEKLEPLNPEIEDLSDSDVLISQDPYDIRNFIVKSTPMKLLYLPYYKWYVIIDPYETTHWNAEVEIRKYLLGISSDKPLISYRWFFIPSNFVDDIEDNLAEYSERDFKHFTTYVYKTGYLIDLEGYDNEDTFKGTSLQESFGEPIMVDNLYNIVQKNKTLSESLSKLDDKVLITDYPKDIINFLREHKDKPYRMLYDKNLDRYCIWDAGEFTHQTVLLKLKSQGYFNNPKVIEVMEKAGYKGFKPRDLGFLLQNYVDIGVDGLYDDVEDEYVEIEPYLLYAVYQPNESDFKLGDDGYDREYKGEFGSLYTRGQDLEDFEFYNYWLGVKNNNTKLNENFEIPNILYHGSNKPNIKTFKLPTFFADNKWDAYRYGKYLYKCKVKFQHPFIFDYEELDQISHPEDFDESEDQIAEIFGIYDEDLWNAFYDVFDGYTVDYSYLLETFAQPKYSKYDGIILLNSPVAHGHIDQYIALDGSKITVTNDNSTLEENYLDDEHKFYDYMTAPVSGNQIFDTTTLGGYSGVMDLITDAKYMRDEKGLVGSIVQMSPNEYFDWCGKIFGNDRNTQKLRISRDKELVDHLKQVIQKYNRRFPMTYLRLTKDSKGQEGRHRMYVAGELFGWDTKFPVLVVQDVDNVIYPNDLILKEGLTNNLFKNLSESYGTDFRATDCPYTVKNILRNADIEYRIVYDDLIDVYFLGNSNDNLHSHLVLKGYHDGWYSNDTVKAELKDWVDEFSFGEMTIDEYFESGEYLENSDAVLLKFLPKDQKVTLADKYDDYSISYEYDFGSLLARNRDFEYTELYQVLGQPKKRVNLSDESEILDESLTEFDGLTFDDNKDNFEPITFGGLYYYYNPSTHDSEERVTNVYTVYKGADKIGSFALDTSKENEVVPNNVIIQAIKIIPKYQRQGFGKTIVDFIKNKYKAPLVVYSLPKAIPFWKSMGFNMSELNKDSGTALGVLKESVDGFDIYDFDGQQIIDYINNFDKNLLSNEPFKGPCYILPNGDFLKSTGSIHRDIFSDFVNDEEIADDPEDLMKIVEEDGWIRCNDGTTPKEPNTYIVLKSKELGGKDNLPYDSIEKWLDAISRYRMAVTVYVDDGWKNYEFYFRDYTVDEIIKAIKRYYSSKDNYLFEHIEKDI